MTRRVWLWARLAGAAAVLAIIAARLGGGPFLAGLRSVSGWSLAAAAVITAGTTICSAWRWRLVSRALGAPMALGEAVAACYRAQFLNTALPGGVLGDVQRGVRQGRDAGDLARGLRSVAWERSAGQAVQAIVAVCVLSVVNSPVRAAVPVVLAVVAGISLVALLVVGSLPRTGTSRAARFRRAVLADLRCGVGDRSVWPGVVGASLLVIAGHVSLFLIAAHAVVPHASVGRLLPLALLVMLAAAVPANIGGWGPREGVAGWSFAAAGLGAGAGVAAGTAFGVLVTVSVLPGAVVPVRNWLRTRRGRMMADKSRPTTAPAARARSHVGTGEVLGG